MQITIVTIGCDLSLATHNHSEYGISLFAIRFSLPTKYINTCVAPSPPSAPLDRSPHWWIEIVFGLFVCHHVTCNYSIPSSTKFICKISILIQLNECVLAGLAHNRISFFGSFPSIVKSKNAIDMEWRRERSSIYNKHVVHICMTLDVSSTFVVVDVVVVHVRRCARYTSLFWVISTTDKQMMQSSINRQPCVGLNQLFCIRTQKSYLRRRRSRWLLNNFFVERQTRAM